MFPFLAILITGSLHIADIQTPRTDSWTASQNPSSLVQNSPFQVALQYENQYFLKELNTASIQAAYCNPYVNVGVHYSFYGYAKYQEMTTGIALARQFGRFSIGLEADYITIYCGDEWKYRGTFIPIIGATVDITSSFTLGLWTYNPFIQRLHIIDNEFRNLPAIYSLGTEYYFRSDMNWALQFDYDVRSTWRIATSFEWQCVDLLMVKLGCYYRQQFVACFGVGLDFDQWIMDFNFELNPTLGVTCLGRISYAL